MHTWTQINIYFKHIASKLEADSFCILGIQHIVRINYLLLAKITILKAIICPLYSPYFFTFPVNLIICYCRKAVPNYM